MPVPTPSTLQTDILAILDRIQPATVRDVVDELKPSRAFTTVATVLGRLVDQGRVQRASAGGRWEYRIASGNNRQIGQRIAGLLGHVAGDPEPLLQALVGGVEDLDPALLDRLETLIANRRRGKS
ncbi:MAG: BlaI/MecI/CopY family transcriptional regulator [Candidatus Binatia bacterium]